MELAEICKPYGENGKWVVCENDWVFDNKNTPEYWAKSVMEKTSASYVEWNDGWIWRIIHKAELYIYINI